MTCKNTVNDYLENIPAAQLEITKATTAMASASATATATARGMARLHVLVHVMVKATMLL